MNPGILLAANVDWAVLIPATIAALTLSTTTIIGLLTRKDVQQIKPKVDAIDHAVNGQPSGVPPLVDKVASILLEQDRVGAELADEQERVDNRREAEA